MGKLRRVRDDEAAEISIKSRFVLVESANDLRMIVLRTVVHDWRPSRKKTLLDKLGWTDTLG